MTAALPVDPSLMDKSLLTRLLAKFELPSIQEDALERVTSSTFLSGCTRLVALEGEKWIYKWPDEETNDTRTRRREFFFECERLCNLRPHPNILEPPAFLVWKGEFIEGVLLRFHNNGNLRLFAIRQRCKPKIDFGVLLFCWARELLRALQHLYKLGLTYRNLKADNCVVAEDSHLILIDMDLSHHCNPYAKPPEFNKCRRKRIQDERVMVWGMHWVIWQISQATEKNPWPERSEKQIPYFEEPVPAAMELLLRKGLQKIPEQRPPLEEAIKEWEAAMIQYNQSALLLS